MSGSESRVHLFGIRHHGPGSARSLLKALESLQPDALLVEGPPEAEAVLPLLLHSGMTPPVALLIYPLEQPRRAVFYPFAEFSPEWQAIRFGLRRGVPVRFMDLPQSFRIPLVHPEETPSPDAGETAETGVEIPPVPERDPDAETPPGSAEDPSTLEEILLRSPREDPLDWLARASGYPDGERWWEHMVERRRESADLFQGIREAMTALRESAPEEKDPIEPLREAHMRQSIRGAEKEGFSRIAVVCGAWHVPALSRMPPAKEDEALLKGLKKVKVGATWTPWTNGRLTFASGYGAGIHSPGWYAHLWRMSEDSRSSLQSAVRWMTKVARLFREEDLDASPAQVIDAVRLAETLAAMRDHPIPGLEEMNEAALTVFCFDSDLPMRLVHEKLIVGEALGTVPDETPMAPLQLDLSREQKRLKLPAQAIERLLDLDLRKPTDLDRSHLLHRLQLLDIPWGRPETISGKSGTFHEVWRIRWDPMLTVQLIEAGIWGGTLLDAAESKLRRDAEQAPDLPALTSLLDGALLADLPRAVERVMARLQSEAALANDVGHLMDALPPLANIARYGNVRKTDPERVERIAVGLIARIAIGLPGACASLNDDAAAAMFDRLLKVNDAVSLLQKEESRDEWEEALIRLADQAGLHGTIAGRCCRLLLNARRIGVEDAARRMSLALSRAVEPLAAAAWVEGFLSGSGLLLLHDDLLWGVLDGWVSELKPEGFREMLPLLRRTFASFTPHERREMGERVKRGPASRPSIGPAAIPDFDPARAEAALALVAQLLGGSPVPERIGP